MILSCWTTLFQLDSNSKYCLQVLHHLNPNGGLYQLQVQVECTYQSGHCLASRLGTSCFVAPSPWRRWSWGKWSPRRRVHVLCRTLWPPHMRFRLKHRRWPRHQKQKRRVLNNLHFAGLHAFVRPEPGDHLLRRTLNVLPRAPHPG